MSMSFEEQPTIGYAIDDPQMLFGEVEIYIAPPFDAGYIIQIIRQLQNHGYGVQHSSGSFQYGCLMTISMEEPGDIVTILANVPGVRDVRISDNLEERSKEINWGFHHRASPEMIGVHRITVTTEPRKEQIQERLESLNRSGEEVGATHGASIPSISGDGWQRLVTLDIRGKALRR